MMRNIILAFVLSWVVCDTFGQVVQYLGSPTTTVRNRGNFVSDSLFYLPKRQKLPSDTGAVRYSISDSTVYVWTGTQWRAVSVSGLYVPYTGATGDVDLGAFSLNAKSIHIKGTGGTGHLTFKHQSGTPSISSNESGLYANTNGDMAWQNGNLYASTFKTSNQTASRTYTFQNKSYVVADSANVALKLNISDTASMLSPYYRSASATAALATKLNISDTASMLSPYYRSATATAALALKLNISDTASMLSPYYRSATASAALALKLNISDTASMLNAYTRGSGTVNYLPKFTGSRTLGNSVAYDNGGTELLIGTTSDAGGYALQVTGGFYNTADVAMSVTSGNVGIGTTNASAKLDIRNSLTSDYVSILRLRNSNAVGSDSKRSVAIEFFDRETAINAAVIGQRQNVQGNWAGELLFRVQQDISAPQTSPTTLTTMLSFDGSTKRILFSPDGTERMRLTSDGELLIASTTDAGAYALQVSGSIYNTTGAVFAASSGSVGIGTSSPSQKLHIVGNNIRLDGITTASINPRSALSHGSWINFTESSLADRYLIGSPGGSADLVFRSNSFDFSSGTERMRLTGDGELLIASSSDIGAYALQVTGAIYNTTTLTTGAPTSGSAKPWRLGEAATVSPTSPNRTIRVEIDGTVYYIHAKTTND